ncbi:hypothetical protein I317_05794 [Kwoniella heveanensis CBS 569]|nr:hypothetical protein I317_05794 [Kwoniella heveanensis CBS 569]
MEMYQGSSTQQPAAICALKSPADAIHILEAVRLGIVPRVTRRLTGHERAMIRPGTVWVWEEEETNMRRWTDGRRWGASRVGGGGFLVYTESSESLSPPPSRSESPYPHGNGFYPGPSSSLRPESLIKQTYSTTMTHPVTGKVKKFHVVAYSSKRNPQGDAHNPLPLPHQLPTLSSLKITPGIWPEWENRRENEYPPVRRTGAPGGPSSSFAPPSQSAPTTAVSSPNGPPFSVHTPPTAFPAGGARPRPPSPGRDRSYPPNAYPPPQSFPRTSYDNRAQSALPPPQQGPVRGPSDSGAYASPYQHPPRRDLYDVPGGPPNRHMSQPPMYPFSQSSSHLPGGGSERFHPYPVPPRSGPGSARVPSYPSSTNSSANSSAPALNMPTTPTDGFGSGHPDLPHIHPRSEGAGSRNSPPQGYPFAYQRPSSSGNSGTEHSSRPLSSSHTPAPVNSYHGERPSPENKMRQLYADGTDPRRYPSNSEQSFGGQAGHPRHASNPSHSQSQSSPNQTTSGSGSQLQPPRSETPSGRSPKMSISSTLLNHDGSSGGVTLPPLRATLEDGRERRQDRALPSPGRISPRPNGAGAGVNPSSGQRSVSNSPTDLKTNKKDWNSSGEDARQLGELGRRVVL